MTLWPEAAGFGHAEDGFTPAFAGRLIDAVAEIYRSGVWPSATRRANADRRSPAA